MESAYSHAAIVNDYLKTEVSLTRVVGPLPPNIVQHGQISRFGVIPKRHQPDKWHLIVDLSHPIATIVSMMVSLQLCAPCNMLP